MTPTLLGRVYRAAIPTLLLALASAAGAAAEGSSAAVVGKVSLLIGHAHVTRLDGTQATLRQGSEVFVGDRVQTGPNGHVHMRFVDHGAVSVRPDSVLEVQAYRYDPARPEASEVRLRVEQGTARSLSGAATEVDKTRFRLNTPIAAIGVRGTDFIVQAAADQVRAVVAEGAISVAPYGAGCSAAGLGPCAGEQARSLNAGMGRLMVEVRAADGIARVAPALTSLFPPTHLADGSNRERGSGESASRAMALLASQPSADPHARTNDTAAADLLAIAPAGRFNAHAPALPPDPQAQLTWGRWSFATQAFEKITVPFAAASNGREVTIGDLDGALFRTTPGQGQISGLPVPTAESGRVDLRLTRAQAVFEVGGRTEAASVDGGTLSLDFGRRTFATALAMSSPQGGHAELRAGGQIDSSGLFNARDAVQRVSGAVSYDGKEAGYLFERAAGSGLFRGRTLWGKGP